MNEVARAEQEGGDELDLLAQRLITAEQDERRRLALFLHDGPVQTLSGIALMLDAVGHEIDVGNLDAAGASSPTPSSYTAARSGRCAISRSISSPSSCETRVSVLP